MQSEEIRTVIHEIVRTELRFEDPLPSDIELSSRLDSVQRLTLVVAIEDHFQICFEPEDDAQIRTLADVVRVIEARLPRST